VRGAERLSVPILNPILVDCELIKERRTQSESNFRFTVCGIKNSLKCEGLFMADGQLGKGPVPLTTFSVCLASLFIKQVLIRQPQTMNQENPTYDLADNVRQFLVQAILMYEQNSSADSYTAYTLRINGTTLQLSMAAITHLYLEEISRGKPLNDSCCISYSKPYDLLERDARRDALKLAIGLINLLQGKIPNT
jgi:hypothetical protein